MQTWRLKGIGNEGKLGLGGGALPLLRVGAQEHCRGGLERSGCRKEYVEISTEPAAETVVSYRRLRIGKNMDSLTNITANVRTSNEGELCLRMDAVASMTRSLRAMFRRKKWACRLRSCSGLGAEN